MCTEILQKERQLIGQGHGVVKSQRFTIKGQWREIYIFIFVTLRPKQCFLILKVNFSLNFQKLFLCGIQCPFSIGKDWEMEGTIGRRCDRPLCSCRDDVPQPRSSRHFRTGQGQGQGIFKKGQDTRKGLCGGGLHKEIKVVNGHGRLAT
jgi:hypothetical protein